MIGLSMKLDLERICALEINSLMHSKINENINIAYGFSLMQMLLINQSIIGRLFSFIKPMLN